MLRILTLFVAKLERGVFIALLGGHCETYCEYGLCHLNVNYYNIGFS